MVARYLVRSIESVRVIMLVSAPRRSDALGATSVRIM